MLSSIRKMYGIYKIMKKITLIIMEGAQFDQSTAGPGLAHQSIFFLVRYFSMGIALRSKISHEKVSYRQMFQCFGIHEIYYKNIRKILNIINHH